MTVQIGIVGCGWWATQAHFPAISANPDAEIAAIADPNPANLARAALRFDVPPQRVFADTRAMLDAVRLEGVIVAVPHVAHAEVGLLVLEHDVHLLIEKPMTIVPDDARMLATAAAKRDLEIVVGYPFHYNRQASALRDRIREGRIGSIEHVSCQFASTARELYRGHPDAYKELLAYPVTSPGDRTYADPGLAGGGQGQTQVTHSAALLFWLTELQPSAVAAMTASYELAVDLVDAAAIGFRSGAIGSLGSTGSVLPGQDERLELRIFGDRGHIVFDVIAGRAAIHGPAGAVEQLDTLEPAERYPERAPADNLVDLILGRAPNRSPAAIGVLTVEFIDAMYRSAAEGRTVEL